MALSASGWKYISSSGATNPLGSGSPASGSWSLRSHSFGECADSRFERCLGRVRVVLFDGSANVLLIFLDLLVIGWSAVPARGLFYDSNVVRSPLMSLQLAVIDITSRHGVT